MPEINTLKILDSIESALQKEYPDIEIGFDTVDQGPAPPAFLVTLVSAEQIKQVGERWKRISRFDVSYYPKQGLKECYAVVDKLCYALELITLSEGELLRGTEISLKITDGVLHFMISYIYFVYQSTENVNMEELKIEQKG